MAVRGGGEDVYASLLLTDSYLPGALVLAHSLRDAGTTKKLAILVTLDSVSADVITQLKAVYNYVIPVPRIRNERPANLHLMNRPDLHSAFTKVNLWRQTQFRKIVYIDADVVAYRAPDELFDLPHAFSAAPDIGWPDLFNTGVMVLTPNQGDYYALMAMAGRGISFDGADQGLLNMHFKNNYNRLSFTYNVTPSAHYQYIPAYLHFQSSINLVHFIGAEKPWQQGRKQSTGSGPFDEMVGRWWAVYDRHYRKEAPQSTDISSTPANAPAPELVQYFVKGEYQPKISFVVPVGEPPRDQPAPSDGQQYQTLPPFSSFAHHDHHHEYHETHEQHQHESSEPHGSHVSHEETPHHQHHHEHEQPAFSVQHSAQSASLPSESFRSQDEPRTEAREEQAQGPIAGAPQPQPEQAPEPPKPTPMASWDAQWQPPPPDSQPEAANFPQTHYEMSSDPAPFIPPERYPSPPKNMWYEVPKDAPAPRYKKIFPWESHQAPATRVFADEPAMPTEPESPSSIIAPSCERDASTESQTRAEPSLIGSSSEEHSSEPQTPTTPVVRVIPSEPWTTYTRTNAWDDVPEIERYVETLQKHRGPRNKSGLKLSGLAPVGSFDPDDDDEEGVGVTLRRRGFRVTDFPSEVERPSLPVTPAPIRRPKFWGGGAPGFGLAGRADDEEQLPAAEGVPAQSDWDPVAQLQKLARQQSELLLQKLSGVGVDAAQIGESGRAQGGGAGGLLRPAAAIPSRSLPFGSETFKSPTYVAARPSSSSSTIRPATVVLSPQPRKPSSETRSLRHMDQEGGPPVPLSRTSTMPMSEMMSSAGPPRHTRPPLGARTSRAEIPKPSYSGPGVAFDKGEVVVPEYETPALATEEEKDILET